MNGIVYRYAPETGEYLGEYQCQMSPLEPGKYLDDIPFTLKDAPPATGANQVACAVDGAWVIKDDFRGVWYKADRTSVEITDIGVVPDQSWTAEPVPFSLSETKAVLTAAIDNAVAAIYNRFTRFEPEYTLREAQAQAFKDAGYTGPVPEQVAAFATPAGMDAQAATDLILSEAANLRAALAALGAKRMRKYEIINAADAATAQAKHDEILAEIEAIGNALN